MFRLHFELETPLLTPGFWQDWERGLNQDLAQWAGRWTRKLAAEAARRAPRDLGYLKKGFATQVTQAGGITTGTTWTEVFYARMVELGRPAGTPPPVAALEGWVRRHWKVTKTTKTGKTRRVTMKDQAVRKAAFALARHIGKHGTQPHPFMLTLLDEYQDQIELDLLRVLGRHGFS